MTSTNSGSLWYVYGVVPANFASSPAPDGLDDACVAVATAQHGSVAALVSRLDHPDYEPTTLEERSGDVEWLSPRAMAHDRVLTWASDRGPVIPFPMFSLFSGERAVHRMLDDRAEQLTATLERIGASREYALRVYRVDVELLAAIADLSPRIRELSATAAAAAPGQRYLLERKLDGEKASELRAVTREVVDGVINDLRSSARAVQRAPIPRVSDAEATRGTMILNAAFLVAPEALTDFQRTLTKLVNERGAQGFRFDFTGPWPPYHFVNEPVDGA